MAGIFKKAYDQADRMLNGSGLSSIVHRQGSGPVIRRFMGGYTDVDAGVEETVSDTFNMSDWSMGGDILGGGLTPKQAQGMTNYIYGKDPGADDSIKKGLQRFVMQKINQPGGPDYSEKEILSDYYKDYPVPPNIVEKAEVLDRPDWGLPAKEYEKLWSSKIPMELSSEFYNLFYNKPVLGSPLDIKMGKGKTFNEAIRDERKEEQNKLAQEAGFKNHLDLLYNEGKKQGYSLSGNKHKDASDLVQIENNSPLARSIEQKLVDKNIDIMVDQRMLDKFKDEFKPTNKELSKIPYGGLLATSPKKRSRELLPHELQGLKSINLATGGKVMPRGLSGINKTININGQPHSLAWINPGEASALKAMGGSGKKVGGIPAYFYIAEGEEYEDVVVGPTGESPTEYDYMVGAVEGPPAKSTGLVDLGHQEIAKRWSEMIGQDIQQDLPLDHPERKLGLTPTRSQQKDVAHRVAQNLNPEFDRGFDLESFAEKYPWFAPFALPIKGAGWLMGRDPNPVVSTVNIKGVTYNLHMDGTLSEQRKDEDYGDDGNEPVKKKFPLKKIAAAEKEEEKELTGIAKLLDKREKKPTEGEALQPQFDNIVAAGFSRQEAADMLNQPVNIFA